MWSTFLVIRIMQIKTIMRYNFIPSRANTFKNIDNTTNSIHWQYRILVIFRSNWEYSYMADGNIMWYNLFERLFYKVNRAPVLWPRSNPLGNYVREIKHKPTKWLV